MPKRVIDGEAVWSSQKLHSIEQEWIRGEYANLLPLALANGVFELDVDTIWIRVYAYLRPHITRENLHEVFAAFERAGLLFRFTSQGKSWAYWVGIDKPGLLPAASKTQNYQRGADVPSKLLSEYIVHCQQLNRVDNMKTLYAQCEDNMSLGIGIGIGIGNTVGARKQRSHRNEESEPLIFTGQHLKVTGKLDKSLGASFPGLDRLSLYRQADGWLEQTGERRRNAGRFLRNWFKRELTPLGARNGKSGEALFADRDETTRKNLRNLGLDKNVVG